jgi:hypothetical protein
MNEPYIIYEPIAPARGCVYGVLFSVPLLIVICAIVSLVTR